MDLIVKAYPYNGIEYIVSDTENVHQALQNDENFFENYMKTKVALFESGGMNPNSADVSNGSEDVEDVGNLEAETLDEGSQSHFIAMGHKWSSANIKLLLELYKERKEDFRDPSIKKRSLWSQISNSMRDYGYVNVTEKLLDRKMRNLKQTYKKLKRNTNSSTGRINWEFFEIFEEIFIDDRTVNPGSTISSLRPSALREMPSCTQSSDEKSATDIPISPASSMSPSHYIAMGHKWNSANVKLLLELYKERKEDFRDPNIKKRSLWSQISNSMRDYGYVNVTEELLDHKMRNLKQTYRRIKEDNKKTSTRRGRINWEFFDIFEEIFIDDRTVNPGSTISSLRPSASRERPSCTQSSEEKSATDTAISPASSMSPSHFTAMGHKWNSENIKLLLELYKERKEDFRDPKIKKRNLWSQISNSMRDCGYVNVTEELLDRKMRNLKQTYMKIKDSNKKKSTECITWEFFDIFEEIFIDDQTVNPGPNFEEIFIDDRTLNPGPTISSLGPSILRKMPSCTQSSEEKSATDIPMSPASSSSSVSFDGNEKVPPKFARRKKSKRKKAIQLEKKRVKPLLELTREIRKSNQIQRERNNLIREVLTVLNSTRTSK